MESRRTTLLGGYLRGWTPFSSRSRFEEWVHTVNDVTRGQVVAIDGKTLQSLNATELAGKSAIHMVMRVGVIRSIGF